MPRKTGTTASKLFQKFGTQLPMFVGNVPIIDFNEWKPIEKLPDLSQCRYVAVDTETNDPGLREGVGSSWAWHDGFIAGISVAYRDVERKLVSFYVPINHPETPCFDRNQAICWLDNLFHKTNVRIIFHNAPYDCGWIETDLGIKPPQYIYDTCAMAVMVDENKDSYSLDNLCSEYGLPKKDETLLRDAVRAYGGITKSIDLTKLVIYRLPAQFADIYARQDAESTLLLFEELKHTLFEENTVEAFKLEMDLIPMTLAMRRRGIRIDIPFIEKKIVEFTTLRDRMLKDLNEKLETNITIDDIQSADRLEPYFEKLGFELPRTKTNKASFTKNWMLASSHWLPKAVVDIEVLTGGIEKFLKTYLLGYQHNGRLYPNINQFKSEMGGTRSFRFSMSEPPVQQSPSDKLAKSSETGAMVAKAFRQALLPEIGEQWGSIDISQQEYRLAVHFAYIGNYQDASKVREQYINNPNSDFHQICADMTGLSRRSAKDVNFAIVYGAGLDKFILMTGIERSKAIEILATYDSKFPFMKMISRDINKFAKENGYIELIDNARCHFSLFEPARYDDIKYVGLPLEKAKDKWPNERLQRHGTHKAWNRKIQGSAARQIKLIMRECWRDGIIPLLQMHDELAISGDTELFDKVKHHMENDVTFSIPMITSLGFGANWSEAK